MKDNTMIWQKLTFKPLIDLHFIEIEDHRHDSTEINQNIS